MRALLVGLSLAATALSAPALAREAFDFGVVIVEPSPYISYEMAPTTTLFDEVFVPAERAPQPVLIHAVIRYYTIPQVPRLQSPENIHFLQSTYCYDFMAIPASQIRIKVFRDEMRERFGEAVNLSWT